MALFKKPGDHYAKYKYILSSALSLKNGGFYCKVEKRRILFNRFKIGWFLVWDGYYPDYNEAVRDLQKNLYRLEGIEYHDGMAC